jgi:hypothetical protein
MNNDEIIEAHSDELVPDEEDDEQNYVHIDTAKVMMEQAREDEKTQLIKDHIKEAIIEGQKNGVKAGEETLIRRDQIEKCIKILQDYQPYSEDVFLPMTKGDMNRVARLLKKNLISPDGVFGSFGREVWNNAIQKLRDESV